MAEDAKIKLTEQEVEKIKLLQQKYNELLLKLGQLAIDKLQLKEFEDTLNKDFQESKREETEYMQELNKKYGNGFLDTKTMEFTPNK